jgi:hypothetical protein
MGNAMVLRFILKTKSSTFAELLADRGHPGPKILYARHNAYLDIFCLETCFPNSEISSANLCTKFENANKFKMKRKK